MSLNAMDWWALVGILLTVALAALGGVWGLVQMMFRANKEHLDTRFAALEKAFEHDVAQLQAAIKEPTDRASAAEKELMAFKLFVAENYVHRDDWIRVSAGRDVTLRRMQGQLQELKDLINEYKRT